MLSQSYDAIRHRARRASARKTPEAKTLAATLNARLSAIRAAEQEERWGLNDPSRVGRMLAADDAFRSGRSEGPLEAIAERFGLTEPGFRAAIRRLRSPDTEATRG